eukprot:g27187.t1
MLTAAMSDITSGAQLSTALSNMGAAVGAGIVLTPFLEWTLSHKLHFLRLSMFGFVHVLFAAGAVPETHGKALRKSWSSVLQLLEVNLAAFFSPLKLIGM